MKYVCSFTLEQEIDWWYIYSFLPLVNKESQTHT